ncbi:MAG TPA: hypothetical protein VNZ49_09005 [Bacteroidia bacterium]|jgi:hypothetical protein|nr:hypothetical protein [Bacteroidia bacterium]
MTPTLDDFFKDNDVRIGKDFQINPPIYYQSLNDGFFNYFKTVIRIRQSLPSLMFYDTWKRKDIAFSFSDSDSTVFTILGLHRFFELLLKDILQRINPFLSVKFLENSKQVIKYLNNGLDTEDVQTIEFSEAYSRFKNALHYAKENPENDAFQLSLKFEFLLQDDTLLQLSRWRNRITHNGRTLPNIFALDYLVTQKIVPLINQILEVESKYIQNFKPHFITTHSGVNIFEELLKIKFDYLEFYEPTKSKHLQKCIFKIAHLKEMARARYNFDPLIPKNRSWVEPYYEDPLGRCLRYADNEKNNKHFHNIKKCPSCGIESLVIYKKMIPDPQNDWKETGEYFFSKCTACDYLLPDNMGDPSIFDLYSEKLFTNL